MLTENTTLPDQLLIAPKIIIQFQDHHEKVTAEVTNLGKNQIILGYTWLLPHNPEIDWTIGTVKMIAALGLTRPLKGTPYSLDKLNLRNKIL
jgi:hypothetical protein